MLPYFLLFALIAAPAIVSGRLKGMKSQRSRLWYQSAILVIAIGLRTEVGGDWYVYLRIFQFCASADLWTAITVSVSDPGYGLVNWVAGQLGLGIWAVNFICALIFTWGLRSFCRAQSNPALAMLVAVPYMCIVVAMGYTRQSVALGLIMAAAVAYQQNKIFRFLVLLIIATSFHKSAIVVAPLFAFAGARNRFMIFVAVVLTALVGYYIFLSGSVDKLLTNYVAAQSQSGGAAIRAAMNVAAALVLFLYRKSLPLTDGERRLWFAFALAAIGCAILLLFSPSSTAVDRIALYLLPLQIVAFSRLPDIHPEQGARSLGLVVGVVGYSLMVLIIWLELGNASWAWIPYQNYLWLPNSYVPKHHHE